jgi:phosphoribosyl-dephospho-CoA transferase
MVVKERMKADVHDLIKLKYIDQSYFDKELPEWALESLNLSPFVVVGRGKLKQTDGKNYIPIGIRGDSREKRFGCFMLEENVEEVITPQYIVEQKLWGNSSWSLLLEQLERELEKWDSKLVWGPTGSIGFELVTKHKVTSENSDLDIIIKPQKAFSVEAAGMLLNILQEKSSEINPVIIDATIQTHKGWISLSEYAQGLGSYLIKTETGEELAQDIW